VILGSTRGQPGINLGSTWIQPGVNLGLTWGQLGVNLGSTWCQPGVNLGSTWDQRGVNLCRPTQSSSGGLSMNRSRRVAASGSSASAPDAGFQGLVSTGLALLPLTLGQPVHYDGTLWASSQGTIGQAREEDAASV